MVVVLVYTYVWQGNGRTAKRRPSNDHPILESDSRPLLLLLAPSLFENELLLSRLRTGKRGTVGSEVERARSQRVTWPAAEAEAKRAGCLGDQATSATWSWKQGRREIKTSTRWNTNNKELVSIRKHE